MTNDFEKQTPSHEKDHTPKWEVVTLENGGQVQKLGTLQVKEPTEWSGSRLKRDAEMQAAGTYPPVDTKEAVEVLANDPDHPQSYTYARLLPDSADCFHIVVSGDDMTANVAQNIPMSKLSIEVGEGGALSLLTTGTTEWGGTTEELPDEGRKRLELFAHCREAAAEVTPEVVIREKPSKRRFGSSILGKLRNR